jgi:hypothetical protein
MGLFTEKMKAVVVALKALKEGKKREVDKASLNQVKSRLKINSSITYTKKKAQMGSTSSMQKMS